ncbi:MAG: hypothetical protein HQK91_04175 [Nitrospirae bacterium]|nr:hypothetical protein [Nitrospirota bacterium]MBF0540632.1 hypothetical protein [Nitrospirota bacterium]
MEMTLNEIEQLIEHKLIDFLGDPDSGLELREDFKEKLEKRLNNPTSSISHDEVIKLFD